MKRTVIFVMVAMVLASSIASADVVGGRAGAFLRTPVGVRAVGLGGAYVAVADDATSLYWNAAGLAGVDSPTIQVAHTSMGLDRKHSLLGVALPLGGTDLVVGALWDRFAVNDIQGRNLAGEPTTIFNDRENMLAGGLALKLGRLSVGGAMRYYQHGLADYSGDGTGYDAGALLDLKKGEIDIALAASICDMGGALSWDTPGAQEDIIPAVTRIGGAMTLPLGSTSLLLAAALHTVEDEDGFTSFGAEYMLTQSLHVRAGMYDDRYALGATIQVGTVAFAFAFAEDVVENASYLTVGVDIIR